MNGREGGTEDSDKSGGRNQIQVQGRHQLHPQSIHKLKMESSTGGRESPENKVEGSVLNTHSFGLCSQTGRNVALEPSHWTLYDFHWDSLRAGWGVEQMQPETWRRK